MGQKSPRVNTTLSNEDWESTNIKIMDEGLETFIRDNVDDDGKVKVPEDLRLQELMQTAFTAMKMVEEYLETDKWEEDDYKDAPTFEDFTQVDMDEVLEYYNSGITDSEEIARETMINHQDVVQILVTLKQRGLTN